MTLRDLRKKQGLTLAKLGEKIGVSYNAIHSYENGKRTPTLKRLKQLAKVLEVSESELLQCFEKEETQENN